MFNSVRRWNRPGCLPLSNISEEAVEIDFSRWASRPVTAREEEVPGMGLWTLLEGLLLLANALAILNEDRFLAPRGWGFQEFPGGKAKSLKGQVTEEDLNRVFKDGPWFIDGRFLSLQPQDPKFCPSKAAMSSVAVWIRILELGVQFSDMEM
ncbi:hypothetical protein NL676_010509 [Syzygium grande]|nr:hypothetical protein NL676_010509 [Syzygium grande]